MYRKLNITLPEEIKVRLLNYEFLQTFKKSVESAPSAFHNGNRWPNPNVELKNIDVLLPGLTGQLHRHYFGDNSVIEQGNITVMWFQSDGVSGLEPHIDLVRGCAINACAMNYSGFSVHMHSPKSNATIMKGKTYLRSDVEKIGEFEQKNDDTWLMDTSVIHSMPDVVLAGRSIFLVSYGWFARPEYSYQVIHDELEKCGRFG